MATCFPFVRYLFFVILFIISVTIIKTSTTLEVVGFNVLNIFALLFALYITSDVVEYTTRPIYINDKLQPIKKKIAFLFSAGALLAFVGIVMTTVAYDKMVVESAQEKRKFDLDKSFRDLIEEIKDIAISTYSLSVVSAIAIFYRWDDLQSILNTVIDPILNTRQLGAWILRILLCVVTASLGISILGSEDYEDSNKHSEDVDAVSEEVFNKGIARISWRTFFGIVTPILMIIALLMKGSIKYLILMLLGLVMLAFTAWIHGTRAKDNEYAYNKYEKPLYGVSYVLAGLSVLEGGSIYTPNALTVLFKIGMPLATVGLSSYLVYLGDKFFQLSRHVHIA